MVDKHNGLVGYSGFTGFTSAFYYTVMNEFSSRMKKFKYSMNE